MLSKLMLLNICFAKKLCLVHFFFFVLLLLQCNAVRNRCDEEKTHEQNQATTIIIMNACKMYIKMAAIC